jgi:nucleoside-diphosphate-sugar epimerase
MGRILVTGGASFIGSHLVDMFLGRKVNRELKKGTAVKWNIVGHKE